MIIAALNDAAHVAAAVQSAFAAGAAEVILSDGGSTDETAAIGAAQGATVIESRPWRSVQFNTAVLAAQHEAIIFLHADTTLPSDSATAVLTALQNADFGGFRIAFAEPFVKLRVAAMLINLRTRLTRRPWGDQAQFVRRSTFLGDGGFREVPLMEDYDLARRMKRRTLLPMYVTTSGRRFLEKGVIRTAIVNWYIVLRWLLGADAGALARMYRS